jgi:hypothetical protein
MQHYESVSITTAYSMLLFMCLDPFMQNGVLYSLVIYAFSSYHDNGLGHITGCCVSLYIQRALTAFTLLYIFTMNIVNSTIAFQFISGLIPQSRTWYHKIAVFLSVQLNLHFFMFGMIPEVHHHFGIIAVNTLIRKSALRNVPQIILQMTIIGLLVMN